MNTKLSQLRWGWILLVGILVPILSIILFTLVITVYATSLAIQIQGPPDQEKITDFANQISPWVGPLIPIVLTVAGTIWIARRVKTEAPLHGLAAGLVAAIILLIFSLPFDGILEFIAIMVFFVLTVAAGWLGGILGNPKREKLVPQASESE